MKEKIQNFLKDAGAFVIEHKNEVYSFSGKNNIDIYFNFFEDTMIVDIQYSPLFERLYEGTTPSFRKFKTIILKSKLNYLMEDYLNKYDWYAEQKKD